jgi:hypothetical protein
VQSRQRQAKQALRYACIMLEAAELAAWFNESVRTDVTQGQCIQ